MKTFSEKEKRYLEDVEACIRLLETLKKDYIAPGTMDVNSSKTTRVRLVIQDLLKKY